MSFDLHIVVTGMCTFVPDKKDERMRVLMPPVHGHTPWLAVDWSHLGEPKGDYFYKDLTQLKMDICEATADGLKYTLCPTIARTGNYLKRRVRRDRMKKEVHSDRIASHVAFGSGGISSCGASGKWEIMNHVHPTPLPQICLAHSVTWTFKDLPGETLTLKFEALPPFKGETTMNLIAQRVKNGEQITLHIRHVVDEEKRPGSTSQMPIGLDNPAPHFHHHFSLFGRRPPGGFPEAILRSEKCQGATHVHPVTAKTSPGGGLYMWPEGGAPYTCMVAGACPCDEENEPDPDEPCEEETLGKTENEDECDPPQAGASFTNDSPATKTSSRKRARPPRKSRGGHH